MINKKIMALVSDIKVRIVSNVVVQLLLLLVNISIYVILIKILFEGVDGKRVGYFIIILIIRLILNYVQIMSRQAISSHAKLELKKVAFILMKSKVLSQSEKIQLSTEGIEQLDLYYSKYVPQFFYSMLAPMILFITVSILDYRIALVLLICVPLIPLSIVLVQKFAKRLLDKYWGMYTNMGDTFLEGVKGITTLVSFKADEFYQDKMDQEAEHFRTATMRVLMMQLNSISMMDLVAYGGSALAVLLSVRFYSTGSLAIASALFIIIISSEFFIPMRLLGSYFHIAMNGVSAGEKIFDQSRTVETNHEKTNALSAFNLSIDDSTILQDINFKISDGEFVGVVGHSGCGKSSLLRCINDHFDDSVLLKHDAHIFKGSIRTNLLMGDDTVEDERLYLLLNSLRLDMSLDDEVLANASNLSGGERQRLAYIRTILSEKRLYLFDEISSSIDRVSEKLLLDGIEKLRQTGSSIVMVSHRMRNIKKADRIIVMDQGQFVAEGKHDSLMITCPLYKEMVIKQESYESEDLI